MTTDKLTCTEMTNFTQTRQLQFEIRVSLLICIYESTKIEIV